MLFGKMAGRGKVPRTRRRKLAKLQQRKVTSGEGTGAGKSFSANCRILNESNAANGVDSDDASGLLKSQECDKQTKCKHKGEGDVDLTHACLIDKISNGIYLRNGREGYDTPDMAISRPDHDTSFNTSSDSEQEGESTVLDTPDYNPTSLSFTILDCLIYLMSIGSYLADVGTDIWVAVMYYRREHWWWCGLTFSFVFLPSLTMGAFSLRWYLIDHRSEKVSWPRWLLRAFFVLFQIAPILRYIDVILFGWKTKKTPVTEKEKKKQWFTQMIFEDVDSALLRLFEAFMEAAPQLVLQLYIMLRSYGESDSLMVTMQWLSAGASLGSLSWALAAYHRALRFSLDNKADVTYCGMALLFLWRIFTIGARVVAFALFASYSSYGVFVIAGVHWVIMVIWMRIQESQFCQHRWEEIFFNVVAACIHIFCYFNLVEGHTRLKYLFYYTLVYLENVGMVLTWYLLTQTEDVWYRYPAIAFVLGGFFIGILFQVIYYLKLHPNNSSKDPNHPSIRIWVPCQFLSCTSATKAEIASDYELQRHPQDLYKTPPKHTAHMCNTAVTASGNSYVKPPMQTFNNFTTTTPLSISMNPKPLPLPEKEFYV